MAIAGRVSVDQRDKMESDVGVRDIEKLRDPTRIHFCRPRKKRIFATFSLPSRQPNSRFSQSNNLDFARTSFSLSIHFAMATADEPFFSARASMASLARSMVAMVCMGVGFFVRRDFAIWKLLRRFVLMFYVKQAW